ncbi:unnamed protein product [Boreogadus saida]
MMKTWRDWNCFTSATCSGQTGPLSLLSLSPAVPSLSPSAPLDTGPTPQFSLMSPICCHLPEPPPTLGRILQE